MTSTEIGPLLHLARELASEEHRLPGASGPRGACLVARQALEQLVVDLLDAEGLDCSRAAMATRLICLRGAYAAEPDLAYRAETAWCQLSAACHHHAYELAPTAGQALALVHDVEEICHRTVPA